MLNIFQIQEKFISKALKVHEESCPAYGILLNLAKERGGKFVGDHIALRTTDPRVAALITKAGSIMNLNRAASDTDEFPYKFPDKLLKSFDLLGRDYRDNALFISVWDEAETINKEVVEAIKEDVDIKWQASKPIYEEVDSLIDKFKLQNGLSEADAERFTDLMALYVLRRNGAKLKQSTFEKVRNIAPELASAMVLGEGINHFTFDVLHAGFSTVEEMRLAAEAAGLAVLPNTLGKPDGLQQSATIGATENIELLDDSGQIVAAQAKLRFMEFIERNIITKPDGSPELLPDGTPKKYDRFEMMNATNIFKAAS
jgi:Domain of unknown function (DUF1338)